MSNGLHGGHSTLLRLDLQLDLVTSGVSIYSDAFAQICSFDTKTNFSIYTSGFPALSVEYGGGAFFIPYLLALILIGYPILVLEIGFGT